MPKVPADICNKRIEMLNNRLDEEFAKPMPEQSGYLQKQLYDAIKFWKKMRDGELY